MSDHTHKDGCHCHGHDGVPSCHEHEHGAGDCGCGHDHDHGAQKRWTLPIVCGCIFLAGLFIPGLCGWPDWVQAVWMAVAAIPALIPIASDALEELERRSPGECCLMLVAAVCAFIIGEWTEGALVLLLFDVGERLEHAATAFSRRSISALAAVAPDTAWKLSDNGEIVEFPAADVQEGDMLYIPPHSRIPADCRVLTGTSDVDMAALTGESQPVYAEMGTVLLSGSVNGSGALSAVALRPCEDSAAARILQLVEEASSRKGRSERFISRFARVYTPLVTGAAVLVAVLPPLFGGGWIDWLYRALAFLVASCPCALVISVPLGFYAGIAAAARLGVLVKGGVYVEKLAAVKAVAFDKTGTLTTDELTLTEILPLGDLSAEVLLRLAASMERQSFHPVGRALCRAAGEDLPAVTELQEIPGLGVTAVQETHALACGNRRLLTHLGVEEKALPDATTYLVRDGVAVAAFRFASALQQGAESAVMHLRRLGVGRLVMLTGDKQAEADAVGRAVGISGEVHGDLLPEDKLTAVKDLQEDGFVTAFVGDGINDAPVLAAADVGIAMGLGSQAAIETADAVLVSGGLSRLPAAIRLCRRVVRTVRLNIAFALGTKALVLALAVFGLAPMWLAVFADVGVTLLTVSHTLTLLIRRKT